MSIRIKQIEIMEFKGTKGKWYFEQDKEYPTLHNIWSNTRDSIFTQGTLIARTCYAPLSNENALLISKAPEMLDMLKKVLEVNKHHNFNGHLINEQIEQLIKQATEV